MSDDPQMPFKIPKFRQRHETYVGADKATAEKDSYQFLWDKLAESEFSPDSILDVGCGTGDLLVYLGRKLPIAKLAGLDIDKRLIEVAGTRQELVEAVLINGDALDTRVGAFDLVTCFGVMGIFDDFEPLLHNLIKNASKGGRIYVHALLNVDNIDVRIAYRDNLNNKDWMRGFNIFSRKSLADYCRARGLAVKFHDFRMKSNLQRRENLPHRAYTVDLADGRRYTTNGLCLLLPETLMEICLPM